MNTGACWMSALNYYTKFGEKDFTWSDHPECVDPVIRALCIWLNDNLEDGERERLIVPHLFAPVGTKRSKLLTEKRAFLVADRAVRVFAPMALRAAKMDEWANRLSALTPITDKKTAWAAEEATRSAARAAWAAADAVGKSDMAAGTARAAARAATWGTDAVGKAARNAAWAAARAAAVAEGNTYKQIVVDLILELCAMGSAPVREACTREALLECLETGFKR